MTETDNYICRNAKDSLVLAFQMSEFANDSKLNIFKFLTLSSDIYKQND